MSDLLDNMALQEIRAHGPITAFDLSLMLNLPGDRENKRREIRRIVKRLREAGHKICADIPGGQQGYWVARDGAEWDAYMIARQTQARFTFVEIARQKEAAQERTAGQQVMFDTRIRKGAFD